MTTIIRKADAAAAAQAGQLTIGQETDKLLEMQKIALQQEQLRYVQLLKTGKPAVEADPIQAALRHIELARAAILRLEPIIKSPQQPAPKKEEQVPARSANPETDQPKDSASAETKKKEES